MTLPLINTQAPALPLANEAPTEGFQNNYTSILRLYFNQLDTFSGALLSDEGARFLNNTHAMLMSNEDQTSAGVTSENLVSYNLPVITNGVRVEDNSKIYFDYAGQYFISFRLQFANHGNLAQEIEVWIKDSGTNLPLSNTRFDIAAQKSTSIWSHTVASVSVIFTINDPVNDYIEVAWWSDGEDVYIEHYPAGTAPARPEVPSVILTATNISSLSERP